MEYVLTKRYQLTEDGEESGMQWTYDDHGNTARIDSLSGKSFNEYTFNEFGDPATYHDDEDFTYTYTYDDYGNVLTSLSHVPNRDDVLTEYVYTYDGEGNVLSRCTKGAEDVIDSYTYNADGQMLTHAFKGIVIERNEYSDSGLLMKVSSYTYSGELDRETVCSYDEAGNLIREASTWNLLDPDPKNHITATTDYTYYENGDLKSRSFDDGEGYTCTYAFAYAYDEHGNIVKQTEHYQSDDYESTMTTYYEYTTVSVDVLPQRWRGTIEFMGKG